MAALYVGVDVGTASARAGVFDGTGDLRGSARRPIRIWQEDGFFAEQSSADIWQAVVACVREALRFAGARPQDVRGIGFDATCSLVVLDGHGRPLPVGPSDDPARDIVMWMDHRAIPQADRITATGHPVLRYVGGVISPEMQTPKLLWLKENRPETFAAAGHFFDLSDYLTWRATGSEARSVCTLTCKWTYLAHQSRWDEDFFRRIGLETLADEGFARMGTTVAEIGAPLANGLTREAADAFGLSPGTPVGASLIDAHAGAAGTLGGRRAEGTTADPKSELALIMGTSSCVMAVTREPVFVPGVWGPYDRALLPGCWLLEGGQSAYGAALDHLVAMHPAFPAAREAAAGAGLSVLDLLEQRALALAGSPEAAARLASSIHIVPEFLGNRSPDADPHATAILCGLSLETTPESLTRLFVASLCALSYGTRQIVETFREKGIDPGTIVVSGGASRSRLLRRILSDATGLTVALPRTAEPVLLGSAMLGAVACGDRSDLSAAAASMARIESELEPGDEAIRAFHARKYAVFLDLQASERRVRAMMRETGAGR
ncbi:FGGY-family carbohydrate kinase [Aurantimonas sp. Leaf443]|uniref:FGGY-family carbohydrate kinase n=1 Tax=Aurantimonas sp. Leaf443 TaxID=1736378 RepID=UPI000701915B|nr:FGGY-family carbohydrate kinase [Aurantimonas sp. Leaf443]KQT85371.1 ribulokinase [Aurantimonas sp. Leaf443]